MGYPVAYRAAGLLFSPGLGFQKDGSKSQSGFRPPDKGRAGKQVERPFQRSQPNDPRNAGKFSKGPRQLGHELPTPNQDMRGMLRKVPASRTSTSWRMFKAGIRVAERQKGRLGAIARMLDIATNIYDLLTNGSLSRGPQWTPVGEGWVFAKHCEPGPTYDPTCSTVQYAENMTFATQSICSTLAAFAAACGSVDTPFAATNGIQYMIKHRTIANRWATVESWWHPQPDSHPISDKQAALRPGHENLPQYARPFKRPSPEVLANPYDPFVPPGQDPKARAIPVTLLPLVQPNPYRAAPERRQSGNKIHWYDLPWWYPQPNDSEYEPQPSTDPAPTPPNPGVITKPAPGVPPPPPYEIPAPASSATFNGGGFVSGKNDWSNQHRLVPWKKKKGKETKRGVRVPGVAAGFMEAFGAATEAADLVDSLYFAVIPALRPHGFMSPWDKVRFLLHNDDLINWREAVKNIIKNQFEDQLYGSLGQGLIPHYQFAGGRGNWFSQMVPTADWSVFNKDTYTTVRKKGGGFKKVKDARRQGFTPFKGSLTQNFNDGVDAIVGTDIEWRMALQTRKTGLRTGGLPQSGAGRKIERPHVKEWRK